MLSDRRAVLGTRQNERGLARLVGLLGQDELDEPLTRPEVAAALSAMGLGELGRHKIAYPLLNLADRWNIELTADQATELARLRRRESILNAELAAVADALGDGAIDYVLMRGPALTRFYPDGWVRQYNDLDILLRNDASIPEVLDRLSRRGYYVARPIVGRASATGVWLGVALNKRLDGLGHPMYLDVTTLGPGLSTTRNITLSGHAWRTLDTIQINDSRIPVLGQDWQVALFGVELVERGRFFVARDVLDLAMLSREQPDWARIRTDLNDHAEAVAALGSLARLGLACERAADRHDRPATPVAAWPDRRRRGPGPRALAALATRTVIRRLSQRRPAAARWLAERLSARLWFALGLPIYLLPPWGEPLRGADGLRLAGLTGYRGRVYPLVPSGYTEAALSGKPTGKRPVHE